MMNRQLNRKYKFHLSFKYRQSVLQIEEFHKLDEKSNLYSTLFSGIVLIDQFILLILIWSLF